MGRKRSLFKDDWEFDGVDGERNIGYGSRRNALLSIILSLCLVLIRTRCADSNATGGSCGIARSWPGVNWLDTAVEICGKARGTRLKRADWASLESFEARV